MSHGGQKEENRIGESGIDALVMWKNRSEESGA